MYVLDRYKISAEDVQRLQEASKSMSFEVKKINALPYGGFRKTSVPLQFDIVGTKPNKPSDSGDLLVFFTREEMERYEYIVKNALEQIIPGVVVERGGITIGRK